jgi:integrase
MRLGELLGFRWRELDLDAALLRVRVALEYQAGAFRFTEPKTPRARRTLALPAFAVEYLRRQRHDQAERRLLLGEAWEDHGVVFDSRRWTPAHPRLDLERLPRHDPLG